MVSGIRLKISKLLPRSPSRYLDIVRIKSSRFASTASIRIVPFSFMPEIKIDYVGFNKISHGATMSERGGGKGTKGEGKKKKRNGDRDDGAEKDDRRWTN